jgi:Cu2+-exporting ATPase
MTAVQARQPAMSEIAVEAGDIVLVLSDPVPRIIGLCRATYRKMVQNLWWAAGYNIAAIPLAAGLVAANGSFSLRRAGPCSCRRAR